MDGNCISGSAIVRPDRYHPWPRGAFRVPFSRGALRELDHSASGAAFGDCRGVRRGVENRLHWVLDVVFHDDLARLRTGNGPQNMAVVKHMAMNLVRNPKDKHSLKNRRKLANLNPNYLETLMRQTTPLT